MGSSVAQHFFDDCNVIPLVAHAQSVPRIPEGCRVVVRKSVVRSMCEQVTTTTPSAMLGLCCDAALSSGILSSTFAPPILTSAVPVVTSAIPGLTSRQSLN